MAKSKKEKTCLPTGMEKPLTIYAEQLIDKDKEDDSTAQLPIAIGTNSTIVLMPELEELVKKNPNRLIGCGG